MAVPSSSSGWSYEPPQGLQPAIVMDSMGFGNAAPGRAWQTNGLLLLKMEVVVQAGIQTHSAANLAAASHLAEEPHLQPSLSLLHNLAWRQRGDTSRRFPRLSPIELQGQAGHPVPTDCRSSESGLPAGLSILA